LEYQIQKKIDVFIARLRFGWDMLHIPVLTPRCLGVGFIFMDFIVSEGCKGVLMQLADYFFNNKLVNVYSGRNILFDYSDGNEPRSSSPVAMDTTEPSSRTNAYCKLNILNTSFLIPPV
jgi:hypothetical protein